MQVNWFTVLAQIVNFIFLVWLLKRFLYKPILKAIDEREEKIAAQIKDAQAKDALAKKEQAEFQMKNEKFEKEKKELMDEAIAETNKERQKLLEDSRNEATELRSKLEKSLKEMQENLNHEIIQKTQQEVFAIAGKTLTDLASLSLEEQSVKIFIKRLSESKNEERKKLIEAFKSDSNPIIVKTAFDLPVKQQSEIKSTVNEILGTKTQFQFKTLPKLISGIELTFNGYKLAWSISEYLSSIQKSISETMKAELKEESEKMSNKNNKEKKKPKAKQKVQAKTKPKAKRIEQQATSNK